MNIGKKLGLLAMAYLLGALSFVASLPTKLYTKTASVVADDSGNTNCSGSNCNTCC